MNIAPFTDVDLALPDRRTGKVRISYALPGARRLFITTDRMSAFDRVVACVPYKGQVLNQLAAWWFDRTRDIVDNHALATPDPNVLIATAATPLTVEVIVRGYITGVTSTSLWTLYADGARTIYGHRLPEGLTKNAPLPHAIITPTTKATGGGHDEPLTCADVVDKGHVEPGVWAQVQDAALALFARASETGRAAGLILADTKFEFGVGPDGRVLLIDEALTPDSSRWWVASSYEERLAAGEEPESLDKEPIRRALLDAGYRGEGEPPPFAAATIEATTMRYVFAYDRITGTTFVPAQYPADERIRAAFERGEFGLPQPEEGSRP